MTWKPRPSSGIDTRGRASTTVVVPLLLFLTQIKIPQLSFITFTLRLYKKLLLSCTLPGSYSSSSAVSSFLRVEAPSFPFTVARALSRSAVQDIISSLINS